MKKILSLVLAALMVFSVIPAVFADDAVTAAADEASAYEEAATLLTNEYVKILAGHEDGSLGLDEEVTRSQMALLVARFITGKTDKAYWVTTANDSGFTDVADQSEEMLGAISFASQKSIVNGYDGVTFGPNDNVEYRQAITMIVRALGYNYKASGYPWSYINKARELGLLKDISNIGYTDAAPRGVVAQLLYNALFAEVEGTTVAESVFEIGKTTVMITASNNVAYNTNAAKVLRTDYVQFQELNDQLEPTGAEYHVNKAQFGIADADLAVGTIYDIYYKDGYANVISYEDKNATFANNGWDSIEVTIDSGYLTLGKNAKLQIVSSYNGLNAKQGWNQDSNGTAQVKLYKATGASVSTTNVANNYWLVGNTIYTINNGIQAWATKSDITGKWYEYDVTTHTYKLIDDTTINAILSALSTDTTGFVQNGDNAATAYTKVVASDANSDGFYDRAIIKNYAFGQINHKGANVLSYTLGTTGKNTFTASGNLDGDKGVAYRWTGLAADEVESGAYAVYYIDTFNKEIDVLFTVGAKTTDDQDTYVATGYVRTVDVANNAISFAKNNVTDKKTIGYDTLRNSPLTSVPKVEQYAAQYAAQYNLLSGYYNKYVTYVVVDDKVVYITDANISNDYVIIDKFTAFTENGIEAKAWSTVDDAYVDITIAAFNGWTIGGLDWNLYVLSNLMNENYNQWWNLGLQRIPVETGVIYKVAYAENGVYNLTTATAMGNLEENGLSFTKTGYMIGTDGSKLDATKYIALSDSDYWMILVDYSRNQNYGTNGWEVISINGKLPFIDKINEGYIYKVADHDYVIETSDADWAEKLKNVVNATDTTYVINANYKDYNILSNVNFLNGKYVYTQYMIDVTTGNMVKVTYDSDMMAKWNPYYDKYTGLGQMNMLVAGDIYKVALVDGEYYLAEDKDYSGNANGQLTGISICNVAARQWATVSDKIGVVEGALMSYHVNGGETDYTDVSYDAIVTATAKLLAAANDFSLNGTVYWETFKGAVSVFVLDNGTVTKVTKNEELAAFVGTNAVHFDAVVSKTSATIWVTIGENQVLTETVTGKVTFERDDNNQTTAKATLTVDTAKETLTVVVTLPTTDPYITASEISKVTINNIELKADTEYTVTEANGMYTTLTITCGYSQDQLYNQTIVIERTDKPAVTMTFEVE